MHPGDHQHQLSIGRHDASLARHCALVKGIPTHPPPIPRAPPGRPPPTPDAPCAHPGAAALGAASLPSRTAMATSQSTALPVERREAAGSRAARRLRRAGNVPGIVYGGGEDPIPFQVDARKLRHALQHAGAVLELSIDGAGSTPVVVKELTRHPVTGATIHIDVLRVRLDQAISGDGRARPGRRRQLARRQGGRRARAGHTRADDRGPAGRHPGRLHHDVSELRSATRSRSRRSAAPRGVTLTDDPETVVATLSPPRLQAEADAEIEEETELVADGATAGEAEEAAGEEAAGGPRAGTRASSPPTWRALRWWTG